jgi:hypothetical protein
MRKIKRGTLKTRSMEMKMKMMMKSRLMYMYGAVFLNLLYKIILKKVTQANRPLFPEVVATLFLWYDKWTIESESVDELIVLRNVFVTFAGQLLEDAVY